MMSARGRFGKGGIPQRSANELREMRAAGRVVAEMHAAIRSAARPGVTTAALRRRVGRRLAGCGDVEGGGRRLRRAG